MTTPHHTPIAHDLLGPAVDPADPCALLGLPSAGFAAADVFSARDTRIARLDAHPLANTPEADDLRLALHAAASLLASSTTAPTARRFSAAPDIGVTQIIQEARLALRTSGGRRTDAVRHVAALAHARGIPTTDVFNLLAGARTPTHARRPSPRPGPQSPAVPQTTEQPGGTVDAIDDTWRIAAIVSGIAMIAIPVLALGVYAIVRAANNTPDPHLPLESSPVLAPPSVHTHPEAGPPYIPPQRSDPASIQEITHELRSAALLQETDPLAARDRLLTAALVLADTWATSAEPDVARANAVLAGALARSASANPLAPLDPHANTITSTAWLAGMRAQIEAARAEPRQSNDDQDNLTRPFRVGVRTELDRLAESLEPRDTRAWAAWLTSLEAATRRARPERDETILRALARLLRTTDARGTRAVEALALAANWRDAGAPRAWLLDAIGDATIPTPALSSLLDVLVSSANAPGAGPALKLAPDARFEDRVARRTALEQAWGLAPPPTDDDLSQQIADALASASEGARRARTRDTKLIALADLARVNAAAASLWNAEDARALNLLMDGPGIIEDALHPPQRTAEPATTDGVWGAAVLEAGSNAITVRGLIESLDTEPGALAAGDARVLAELAFRGSPRDLRDAATDAMLAGPPSIALLEVAAAIVDDIPRTTRNAEVISQLTGHDVTGIETESMTDAFRKAILSALLDAIQSRSGHATADRIARVVAQFYAEALPEGSSPTSAIPDPAVSAAALAGRWAADLAERPDTGARLAAIERRRSLHAPLARDPIAAFGVHQRALVETLALHAATDPNADGARIEGAVARLAESRPILDTLLAAELARAQIWQARLERSASR